MAPQKLDPKRVAIGARARQAREQFTSLSAAEMGRQLGFDAAHMFYRNEQGQRGLSPTHLAGIARITGVRVEWLATGEGPMRADAAPDPAIEDDEPHTGAFPVAQSAVVPMPQAIAKLNSLIQSGRLGTLSVDDWKFLREHLAVNQRFDEEALEQALLAARAFRDPNEETVRAYNAAVRRQRQQSGMKSFHSQPPVDNDQTDAGGLRLPKPPRPPAGTPDRRRKR